jgi:tryptophan-rich sensory protein
MNRKQALRWPSLVLWIILCEGTGWIASQWKPGAWHAALVKPAWNPPGVVFFPVWTLLYALMGVAAWLVWQRADAPGRRVAVSLFLVQLFLNGTWSWIFFGLHAIGIALFEIALLWLAILTTILTFRRISTASAWLLAPYLAWVSFAAALTFALLRLNG